MTTITKIDGSMLEGGGAIVRNSIALSILFKQPIEIFNIRAKRSKPGLRNQHAFVIRTLAEICGATIEGVEVGSMNIRFFPDEIKAGEFKVDVQTAGSLTLLLQAIIPVAAHATNSIRLLLKGGTDVPWSPPYDYLRYVYLPMMKKIGLETTLCIGRRGHYPKGGGTLTCDIAPLSRAKPIQFDLTPPFEIEDIYGRVHCIKLPETIADRMIDSAEKTLQKNNLNINSIEKECPDPKYDPHLGPGTGITL
ncbi:MAG: RNA 3'-phosphate cyclase, partial [Asgard group archaeon]|nr:RNA 3'-phosphate cyclase [Asgard group archaeon]